MVTVRVLAETHVRFLLPVVVFYLGVEGYCGVALIEQHLVLLFVRRAVLRLEVQV